ncbi:ammonia-forming cytochrome c nitrite reductase subunit c552 [Helicobacter sp. MIT 99-5507]|uniref:ammonia-forming cytochrome c nitrite reductase subunit c552 n=1 Tax=Helicobacter sp. MIT 99-5507 TaxID=152489 RepID=UPI000E1F4372|nr:ammonia-forming cytochrome c nitrite reductase subunit c552 [Helicobacter sp. MIT 99-5507]RDU57528.1 ammonia-forming cytochrome c nitrite reductase subunit c552 [Helicobacter sp. MIT 99-5507]
MSKQKSLVMPIVLTIAIIIGVAIVALLINISTKKNETMSLAPKSFVELSDDNPTFDYWGKNYPEYLDMYLKVEKEQPHSTNFGGNLAYSKLIRYPQLTILWAGYPFSIDANEERGHFWIQEDQMKTARNNKDFLNAHGFKAFGGQPTACMNCHSGWSPWLYKNASKGDSMEEKWVSFNSTKYWTMIKNVPEVEGVKDHSGIHGGTRMGVTCADCHNPQDMTLRITRQGLINSLAMRGYEKDPVQGIKADRNEMRTLVCAQCHVEYYFKPTGNKVTVMGESIASDSSKKWFDGTQKTYDEFDSWRDGNKPTEIQVDGIELVFPWSAWEKGKPFRIEMFDEHYDKVRNLEGGKAFKADWTHKDTKAPMIKIQHPETELYSGSVHAANNVSCADCHMPYIRKGAKKVTQHNITSPLFDINSSCKTCHNQSEEYLKNQVADIQKSVAFDLRSAEYATVSLIWDIKKIRDELGKQGKNDEEINNILKEPLELHRKGQMRGDFVGAENSTGFHNPREASRMLLQAVEMARQGQSALAVIAGKYNIEYKPSNATFEDIQKFNPGEIKYKVDMNGHKAGDRYYEHLNVNGNPPKELLELDKNVKPYVHTKIDNPVK